MVLQLGCDYSWNCMKQALCRFAGLSGALIKSIPLSTTSSYLPH